MSGEIGHWRMKTDDFKLIKVIGRGAFGEVQLVRHKLPTRSVSYRIRLVGQYQYRRYFFTRFMP